MEYIYIGIGFLVAFACIWCYRRGVKDGMSIKHEKPLDKLKPVILQTKEEKQEKEEDLKTRQIEHELIENISTLLNYQPKHITKKE